MSLSACLISVIFTFFLQRSVNSCSFHGGKYDLESLDWPGGWPVTAGNDSSIRFIISLCGPLNYTNCEKSSVCKISGNTSTSYADALDKDLTVADDAGRGFSLYLITKRKCSQNEYYRAAINFACGSTLGSPEVSLHSDCQVNFIWRTSAACPAKADRREVPCYVIDSDGRKRDLSNLIKREGGYRVRASSPEINYYINVCSEIKPSQDGTQNCTLNSSACGSMNKNMVSFGEVSERLKLMQEGLVLNYESNSTALLPPSGCNFRPKTRILFKCPSRGQSQWPVLVSNYYSCHHEVIWYTEHACPESSLKGDRRSCQFTQESHGVAIDLSPLKSTPEYHVSANVSGTEVKFTLGICQGLGATVCGGKAWKSNSVCMTNSSSNETEVVGTTVQSSLRYVDGQVILTYPNGNKCSKGVQQTTIINFICNSNLSTNGVPQHVSSDECFHIFNWETKLACLKRPIDSWCSAVSNNTRVNLEKLHISYGAPWEAVDRRDIADKDDKNSYFLNVCGEVSNLGYCEEGSAVCLRQADGKDIDLGKLNGGPIFDPISGSVKLEYYLGSQCNDKLMYKSTINFICRPGFVNSEPVLKRVDKAACHYEFEWLTDLACPDVSSRGEDCVVHDSALGITYDLTPLKSKFYEATGGHHKFYLSICEPITGSPCSANLTRSVSACMIDNDKNGTNPKVIGESNSTLLYSNGIINLDYYFGDKYNQNSSYQTSITFMCDHDAGNGKPVFVEQEDSEFIFHWYTSLVCSSPVTTECVIHDPVTHLVYDLSQLSLSKRNWEVIINDNMKKQTIYLNVCRSLTLPVKCDPNAAACVVEGFGDKEKAVIPNIGQITGPPEIKSSGHLTLTYSNGEPCTAFGVKTNYSTTMHFLCAENNKFTSGPRFLNKVGECEYTFLWTTSAACPTGNLISKNSCQLTDPESGFTFDLMPLSISGNRQPYIVTTGSRTFELNICGSIADGCHNPKAQSVNVSVCETKNDTQLAILGVTDNYTLSYSQGQDLSLTYKNGTQMEVVIRFPCKNSTRDPQLRFIEENPPNKYHFEMQTSLTCIPAHFDCSFVNSNGDEYDLSPLSKYSHGNWEVSDGRFDRKNLRYHINFCRPLNKDLGYNCPGGTSSACQTDTANPLSNGFNLGSQMAVPTVSKDGIITIKYTEGSFCHNGQFKRSTTINLFCAHSEGELKLVGETPECEYIFSLQTPAACPVEVVRGSNCKVVDPVFGYMFDLRQLQKKGGNYNITVGEYVYSFNICGKLNGFAKDCENAGICQTKPNFSKSLGVPSSDLAYRKGLITLQYKNGSGSCHGKYNRSSKITFTCDHAYEDRDGPIFISEAEDCEYLFEWPTVHACPPFDVIECSIRDEKGNHYDLSKLSLSNDNYYVKNPEGDNATFAINLCRSIVPTPDSLCPYTAAACLVNSTNPLDSVSLGRVGQELYFEDGHIKIKYTTGDPCDVEKTSTARFMQTIIEFSCDKKKLDSRPEFIGKEGCTYYFDWYTAYACISEVPSVTGECRAVDYMRGIVYDLSPLKNHTAFTTQYGSHKFYVNVCDGAQDNPCQNHSGMCQEEISGAKRHWNGGVKNDNLQFTDGILFLNYSGGDSCHNGQFQRNTIIQFQCGRGLGEPVFIYESDDCTYFLIWETELACDPFVHCAIKNGSQYYDLSAFTESYFVAGSSLPNDNASYYISVCGSLPRINGIDCPHGAAICQLTEHKEGSTMVTSAQSLGRVEHHPFIDFEGHPTSIYTNGSQCATMPGQQNRARIIFLCQSEPGFLGEPELIDKTEDCLYIFEWKTNVVCPEQPIIPSASSCGYADNGKGLNFDLSPIQRIGSYYTVSESANKTDDIFLLNVCETVNSSSLEKCKNSGICLQKNNVTENYGLASTLKFSYDGSRLRMSLFEGDDCPLGLNGKRSSDIFFVCDPSAGLGKPELFKKYTCLVVFVWKTTLVCQNTHHQCSFDVGGNHYDLSLLSSLSHNWNTTDLNNLYWLNLCRGILPTEESKGCAPAAAVCYKDKNGSHVSLGMVQTMQVKANNSDLLLTFGGGDRGACTSVNSATPLLATTRIVMRCSHSLGKPKILSGPDTQCFYDFLWETSLACPEKTEEVMIEENGTLYDTRFQYSMDLTDILNQSFSVVERSRPENYTYEINLSRVFQNSADPNNDCAYAAVCQTKPGFFRDIGSFDTRKFYIRGSELHLILTSRSGPCGKDRTKNVTTIFNMACSSAAGIGTPKFLYESGNCDYIFEWETIAVCPAVHRPKPQPNIEPDHQRDVATSSHTTETVIGVIVLVALVSGLMYILVNRNRRSAVALRFRGLCGRINLPHFQYKRGDMLTELQSDF